MQIRMLSFLFQISFFWDKSWSIVNIKKGTGPILDVIMTGRLHLNMKIKYKRKH
jgi:hypothetical protein